MNVKSINDEYTLIKRLSSISSTKHNDLIHGIGDDAAVIKHNKNSFLLVTTDMLVENTHFKIKWSSAKQIGRKATECNVSDIAAMGGKPTFMFVSISIPKNTEITWIEELYKGINLSCKKHGIILAGGDTTHGNLYTINITLLGSVSSQELCLRSHAKKDDLLAVTGHLGGASAGLLTLSLKQPISTYLLDKHTTPKCKLSYGLRINSIVNAMTDISDGLASEIHNICNNSMTGAEIYENKLPIHNEVFNIAKKNNKQALDFAIMGGEDLELLFSFNPNKINLLKKTGINYYIIGKITTIENGINLITKLGIKKSLKKKGYDHFE